MSRSSVQDFMLRYLEASGRAPREVEPGIFRATGDGAAVLDLTFDPEAAGENPSCELVTLGHPMLETALTETLAAGRIAHVYGAGRRIEAGLLEQRIRSQLGFDRVRLLGLEDGRLMEGRVFRIRFIVSIHGDVVQQVACPVWVDGTSGRPADSYRAGAARRVFEDRREETLPLDREASPAAVVASALDELVRQTEDRLTGLQTELDGQRRDEERRVRAYFRQREEEVEATRHRARSPETVARADQTLATVRAERDMRLHEAGARYRARIEARVAAVEVMHVPRLVIPMLVQMGTTTFRLPVRYDLVVGSVIAPDCPTCGEPAEVLVGARGRERPGCGGCLRRASSPAPDRRDATGDAVAATVGPAAEARGGGPGSGTTPVAGNRADGAGTPAAPANPSGARPSRAGHTRARLPTPAEPVEPLLIHDDLWLLLARTVPGTRAREFDRVHDLPDRTARGMLRLFDGELGGSPIEVLDQRRDGRLLGRGLTTFLARPLLALEWIEPGFLKEWHGDLARRLLDGVRMWSQRVLKRPGILPGNCGWTPIGGVDHHIRLMVTFRVGPAPSIGRSENPLIGMVPRLHALLRQDLGLTGNQADLWPILRTSGLERFLGALDVILERLADLSMRCELGGPGPEPEALFRDLVRLAQSAPSKPRRSLLRTRWF